MDTRRDILSLEENTTGKDYIMGDLHGNADCLDAKLKQLQPEDRLFIAGDLTDRGTDSPRVISLILDYQAKHPNKLYIVLGNHEDVALRAMTAMAEYSKELASIPYSQTNKDSLVTYAKGIAAKALGTFTGGMKDIHCCLMYGGFWLLELFRKEMLQKNDNLSQPDSLTSSDNSLIAKYQKLISELPYIIYVKGRRPFVVVHADMPISHQTMLARIADNIPTLSEAEKQHAMYARTRKFDAFGRVLNADRWLVNDVATFPFTMIIYCGHNIIDNKRTFVTRPGTNTVVLDTMAWANGVSLVVCHPDSTCEYVGPAVVQKGGLLEPIQYELSAYLKMEAARYAIESDENSQANSPAGTPTKRSRSTDKSAQSNSLFSQYGRADESRKKQLKSEDNTISGSVSGSSQPWL